MKEALATAAISSLSYCSTGTAVISAFTGSIYGVVKTQANRSLFTKCSTCLYKGVEHNERSIGNTYDNRSHFIKSNADHSIEKILTHDLFS